MKKLAVTALSLFLVLSPSLAKTSAEVKDLAYRKHSVLKTPTRTKSVLARAVPRAQRRLLVINDITDGDDGPPGPNELDLHNGYRRPESPKALNIDSDSDDLSDYVVVRLAVARARAMARYRAIHA
jgi:hypothetical protein